MEVVKLLMIAVLACVIVTVVSQYRPEYALLIQLCTVAVLLGMTADTLIDVVSQAKELSQGIKINNEYISLLLKALIIAIGCRIVGEICSDTGNRAIAACVDLVGRLALLVLSLPLLTALSQMALELIKE